MRVFLKDVPLERRMAGVRDLIEKGEIDPEEREAYFLFALNPPPEAAGWTIGKEPPPLRVVDMTPEERLVRQRAKNRAWYDRHVRVYGRKTYQRRAEA